MARVTYALQSCRALAYDHNAGGSAFLAVAAVGSGWVEEELAEVWSDREVAGALTARTLAVGGPQVLLVHLDDDGLEVLERGCGESVTIVACSTAPHKLVSEVPGAGRPLLLRLRTRLGTEFSGAVLGGLLGALDGKAIESLRSGLVPEALRRQFAFRESLLVQALLILVQGAIGAPGVRPNAAVASAAWWRRGLGITSAAPPRDCARDWPGFVSDLALELGMDWSGVQKRAPESTRLLRSLRHDGGATPRDCNWPEMKRELERLLWPD